MGLKHFSLYICIQSELIEKVIKNGFDTFLCICKQRELKKPSETILRHLCMNCFDDFLLKTRTNYANCENFS